MNWRHYFSWYMNCMGHCSCYVRKACWFLSEEFQQNQKLNALILSVLLHCHLNKSICNDIFFSLCLTVMEINSKISSISSKGHSIQWLPVVVELVRTSNTSNKSSWKPSHKELSTHTTKATFWDEAYSKAIAKQPQATTFWVRRYGHSNTEIQ